MSKDFPVQPRDLSSALCLAWVYFITAGLTAAGIPTRFASVCIVFFCFVFFFL